MAIGAYHTLGVMRGMGYSQEDAVAAYFSIRRGLESSERFNLGLEPMRQFVRDRPMGEWPEVWAYTWEETE